MALMVIPALTSVLMFTWPMNRVFFETVVFTTVWPLPHLITTGSVWYDIFNIFSVAISVLADGILVYHYKIRDRVFKRQSVMILLASVLPVCSVTFIQLLGIWGWSLDLTPVFLGIACVCLGYSFLRLGFYRFAPIAREQTVEAMKDGYITLDMKGNIIDVNRAARSILPQLATTSPGMSIGEVEGASWLAGAEARRSEFEVSQPDGSSRYYQLSENEVIYGGRVIGRCIMIFDTTETRSLLEEVRQLAERDSLTSLLNRGTLFAKGAQLLGELSESGGTACLLMIDLDHFKIVNDTYGHLKGDEVLLAIARELSGRLRRTDLLARYGGEEFCALLPDVTGEDALDIARDLKNRIGELAFESGGEVFGITVSMGLAIYEGGRHTTLETLIADADAALYAAKNAGRNAICTAGARAVVV
jgi:diguanylate cyclase (GGDEF)-like protein